MSTKNTFQQPTIESESIESLSAKLLVTTARLAEANKELEKTQKERNEMLANISHDLRAPITAIRSTVDYLMSANPTSEEYQSSLQLIDRRTKNLESLIQDMYYLFCVEDTSRELKFETVDACMFLEEYFFDATIDSRYDSHDMQLELPEDLHCQISIDIQKMIRVLDNLMTNAAKYTQTDSNITLKACKESGTDDSLFCISVSDNGPGIPEESVSKIFNRTYTVSNARTPGEAGGSGLGLSIVKAIVERHGGTITCESIFGKGCIFRIKLPISI